jgi:hypothetical protein
LSSTPHPLGNEDTLIFRDGTTNLQQQLIMRILTHRTVQKFHRATGTFQFLDEDHLVNVVPRESIRAGDHHAVQYSPPRSIPELVQPGPIQARSTVTIVSEDVLS